MNGSNKGYIEKEEDSSSNTFKSETNRDLSDNLSFFNKGVSHNFSKNNENYSTHTKLGERNKQKKRR